MPYKENEIFLRELVAADQKERQALNKINDVKLAAEMSLKLVNDDAERRELVYDLMSDPNNKTAFDYYCAALIYAHGKLSSDYEQAYNFANKAYNFVKFDRDEFAEQVKLLYATSYDKWQISIKKDQKYGMQRHLESGEIIGINPSNTKKLTAMDSERKSIGIYSIKEQDNKLNIERKKINEQRQSSNLPRLTPIYHNHVDQDKKKKELELQPTPVTCSNCLTAGHFSAACTKPKKK